MNDKHRYFIQYLMGKRIANSSEIRSFFQKYCLGSQASSSNSDEILAQFVSQINTQLRPLQLEIKKGYIEENGQTFFALINTMDNHITRLSSDYTVPELELFKKVLVMILESEEGEVPSSTALNATDQLEHRMTKSGAEIILKKFMDNDILKSNQGKISLSPFCQMELDTYLRTHFEDYITICFLCKQIVLKGRNCDSCEEKFHYHCADKLMKNNSNVCCPKCKTQWPYDKEQQEENSPRSSQNSQRASQSTPRVTTRNRKKVRLS